MKNEFVLAFNEVLEEKQLPRDVILQALESAMVSAYRRAVNASGKQHVEAKIDSDTGKISIYAEKEVVDSVLMDGTEVNLEDARKVNPEAELGDLVIVESTPADFGRIAAQTARQVIQQRIREAERASQMEYYEKQLGEIATGVVQAVNSTGITIGLDLKAEGLLPRKETIPGERFRVHERARALLLEVKDTSRGPQIILSRAHRNFLRRLLETEVPEIYHGVVEIRSISREPGQRAKVAVAATQQGIDPVGACVGIRGVRIQAIVRELHDEKIDVIEWSSDPAVYISKAISPARVNGVYLNDVTSGGKTATVVVPEDQLSLAIGRDGQNARLAAKLTGWRIDIKSLAEASIIPSIEEYLQKKVEGRPLNPEEYDQLAKFVDRVEKKSAIKRQAEKKTEDIKRTQAMSTIEPRAFEAALDELKLEDHITSLLLEAGYITEGELALQLILNPDSILALQGIGPKAMTEIEAALQKAQVFVVEEVEVEKTVEAEPEVVLETKPASEPVLEKVLEPEVEEVEVLPVEAPVLVEEEELTTDLNKLFELNPDVLVAAEEDDDELQKKDIGKKKKKKHVEITYDPDRDLTVVKKIHKRGADDGQDDWDA
jgi:N utilization substance protein A